MSPGREAESWDGVGGPGAQGAESRESWRLEPGRGQSCLCARVSSLCSAIFLQLFPDSLTARRRGLPRASLLQLPKVHLPKISCVPT